jgi:menaquinone-9 beta-reductase
VRREAPLILGAGPAGCAAAIRLAASGERPVLLERSTETGDAICGGFMSWRTLATLEGLGVDTQDLGGHRICRLRLYTPNHRAEAPLPGGAIGVSRHRLDTLLQARAVAMGVGFERGVTARQWHSGTLTLLDGAALTPETLFLATGKHDLRGIGRDRGGEPTLGLRLRLAPHPALSAMVGDAIELHLFDGGYAGIVLQEDGSANCCLAVRKARLTAENDPHALMAAIGREVPALGERLALAASGAAIDAIAAIPYGWIAKQSIPGLFRLGDQAASIPSLAGEGIGIALASGDSAARHWSNIGKQPSDWQGHFAKRASQPVSRAIRLWHWSERPAAAAFGTRLVQAVPVLGRLAAHATRLPPESA